MAKTIVTLSNTVFWDDATGEKVDTADVQIALVFFPFDTRQVFLRFARGLKLDLSIQDMDRMMAAYAELRATATPPQPIETEPPDPVVSRSKGRRRKRDESANG